MRKMSRGRNDECGSKVVSADFSRRGLWGTSSQAPCTYTVHTPIVSTMRSEMRADLKTVERLAAYATIKKRYEVFTGCYSFCEDCEHRPLIAFARVL